MSVLLDEDTIVLEGLEFDIECMRGQHSAALSVECRFCPRQMFVCRKHWTEACSIVDDFLASHLNSAVSCSECGTDAWCLDDLVRVVPL